MKTGLGVEIFGLVKNKAGETTNGVLEKKRAELC